MPIRKNNGMDAENLIGNVRYKVEEFSGLNVVKVNVFVEGVRVID